MPNSSSRVARALWNALLALTLLICRAVAPPPVEPLVPTPLPGAPAGRGGRPVGA